ncbi:hypothetical protein [Bartonella grahamii]|nr:hypothetical protein [Bartonella grahamii]
MVQIDGATKIACWCLVAGRLLMPLGCGGRIDNPISIAKEKEGRVFWCK